MGIWSYLGKDGRHHTHSIFDRFQNRVAVPGNSQNDMYKHSSRDVSQLMSMSQRRRFCANDVDFFQLVLFVAEIQSNRRSAHNPTAPLAVIQGGFERAIPTLRQSGQTGISRRSAAKHFSEIYKP